MISYGDTFSNIDNMNVIPFMNNDHSNCTSEVYQSKYYAATRNVDSSDLQQQFSTCGYDYVETASNAMHVTSNNGLEVEQFIQTCNIPKNNTPQLLHQIEYKQPTHYNKVTNTNQVNRGIRKCHRASITLIRTSEGNFKAVVKRKQKRTVFTTEQIEALEQHYCQKQYVTHQERQLLVNKLNLNDKAVKIWFQNRRLKGKRDHEPQETPDSCIRNNEILHHCLDYVESQIKDRTDESGYVTLDDTLTGNLVNVIDAVLENRDWIDLSSKEFTTKTENNPIYEPISPAEYTGEEALCPNRELYNEEESSQVILDFKSVFSL